MSFFFGNKNKTKDDLDAEYYERQKAYNKAKQEQRLKNARAAGIRDAEREANRKPFYKKLAGVGMALGKDMLDGASKTNPDVFFSFDKPKPKRRRQKKRKR